MDMKTVDFVSLLTSHEPLFPISISLSAQRE